MTTTTDLNHKGRKKERRNQVKQNQKAQECQTLIEAPQGRILFWRLNPEEKNNTRAPVLESLRRHGYARRCSYARPLLRATIRLTKLSRSDASTLYCTVPKEGQVKALKTLAVKLQEEGLIRIVHSSGMMKTT